MAERVIRCAGRRRLTVMQTPAGALITIWLKDPPTGRKLAGMELERKQVEQLVLALVETLANA